MATYWENSCSFGLQKCSWVSVPDCLFVCFLPRFLEWESLSDCVFFLIFAYFTFYIPSLFDEFCFYSNQCFNDRAYIAKESICYNLSYHLILNLNFKADSFSFLIMSA